MNTVFASFVALCLAEAPPFPYDDVVLVWGGAACASDVTPGVVGQRPAAARPSRAARFFGPTARFVSDDHDTATAKAWIGVRLAPIPEALAAHLDRTGLMVANVATGSPADAAGLERYDVIVAFDGVNTESGQQLVDAIGDVGPGREGKITVLRKGSELDLKITPTTIPAMDGIEYKYDEPPQPVIDDKTSIRGHKLRIGPDGQLQLEDLGQLDNLPDVMKNIWAFPPNGQFDWRVIRPGQVPIDMNIDLGGTDADAQLQLQIQTTEDGETLMVRRDADGKITVERTDANGGKTTTEYDDADALEQGDAEAHELYSRHAGGGLQWLRVRPRIADLPNLQKDFRDQVERQMKDIRDQAAKTRQDAQQWRRSARPQAPQNRPRVRVEARSDSPAPGGTSTSESLSVVVDDDGRITVKVNRNGNRAEYTFKNEADFKAREPELFERYEKMSE